MTNMIKTQTPRKWFGQRHNKALQPELRIVPREVTMIRILKKAPYKITYAEFTYAIQPVTDMEGNVSYIAARMLTATAARIRAEPPLPQFDRSRKCVGDRL
jgi:hypothetical protein